METWPISLQSKLNSDSFTYAPGDTLLKSDVDAGPSKTRSRYTDGVDKYSCTITLKTQTEVTTLQQFYKTALNNGAKTFAFVDPFDGTTAEFRFDAPPNISPLGSGGTAFKVSMLWIRMP